MAITPDENLTTHFAAADLEATSALE